MHRETVEIFSKVGNKIFAVHPVILLMLKGISYVFAAVIVMTVKDNIISIM